MRTLRLGGIIHDKIPDFIFSLKLVENEIKLDCVTMFSYVS